jgi:hypothetical protein
MIKNTGIMGYDYKYYTALENDVARLKLILRNIRHMGELVEMFKKDKSEFDSFAKKTTAELLEVVDFFDLSYDDEECDIKQPIAINKEIIKLNSERRLKSYLKYLNVAGKCLEAIGQVVRKSHDNG